MKDLITNQIKSIEIQQILALQADVSIDHARALHHQKNVLIEKLGKVQAKPSLIKWMFGI